MTPVIRRVAASGGAPVAAVVLLAALLVAACGAATSTSTTAAVPSPPGASGSPGASPSEAIGPSPTSWPGGVVEATVLLGKADLEIQKAGGDLGAAAANEDLEAMWGAADGFAPRLGRNLRTRLNLP